MKRLKRYVEPLLFNVNDVATMIGFSRSETYEIIREGVLPHIVVEGLKSKTQGSPRQRGQRPLSLITRSISTAPITLRGGPGVFEWIFRAKSVKNPAGFFQKFGT